MALGGYEPTPAEEMTNGHISSSADNLPPPPRKGGNSGDSDSWEEIPGGWLKVWPGKTLTPEALEALGFSPAKKPEHRGTYFAKASQKRIEALEKHLGGAS